MNLDSYGLPVQSDGDALDQLNRVGILSLSNPGWYPALGMLYRGNGEFVRHFTGEPGDVSGDQLVPVFATHILNQSEHSQKIFGEMTLAMLKRLGFAQNINDTDGSRKLMPDFLLHRVLPFIARVYTPRLAVLADVVLFVNTLATVIDLRMRNNPDHVDPFVNACATLYACNVYRPTYLSKLSARLLEAGALKNTLYIDPEKGLSGLSGGVTGGLRHYHRAASGGNPEVGDVQIEQWVETLKIARS